jgi:hypothetical protein
MHDIKTTRQAPAFYIGMLFMLLFACNRPVFSFDVTPDNKKIIASSIVDVNMLFAAEIPWD